MKLGFTVYLLWDPAVVPNNAGECSIGLLNGGTTTPIYTASGCASIPVPLDAVSWGCSGDAVKTLNPTQKTAEGSFATTWYLTGGSAVTPTYAPVVYPTWGCTENVDHFNMSIYGTCPTVIN